MENEPKVVVIDMSAKSRVISEEKPTPSAAPFLNLIRDLNTTEEEPRKKVFQNICFDPLGDFAGLSLDFLVAIQGSRKGGDTYQIQDYNPAIAKMREVINATIAKRVNVVMLAHWQLEKDSVTERIRQTPLVWGKTLPVVIHQWFSNAIEQRRTGDKYEWVTQPEGFVVSLGTRITDRLTKSVPPDFTALLKSLNKLEEGSSFLLIGEPFSGKTYSLATLPGRVLLFNFQPEGWQSLRCSYAVYPTLRDYWSEFDKKGERK